jgi:hypothetical protein
MADDPDNTKAAFDRNWVSATEIGKHLTQMNGGVWIPEVGDLLTQSNDGVWILALLDIRDALRGGCPAVLELDQGGQKSYASPPPGFWLPHHSLRCVNAINPSLRREDFPGRPWQWEVRAYLSPRELGELRDSEGRLLAREQVGSARPVPVFLLRAEAVKWGLWPASKSPQAVASEAPPAPGEQLQTSSAHAQNTPEQPKVPSPAHVGVTENAPGVTKKRGRPSTGKAKTGAERQRALRAARKGTKGPAAGPEESPTTPALPAGPPPSETQSNEQTPANQALGDFLSRAKRVKRRGPKRGTVDRYGKDDRALFEQMTKLIETENLTRREAAKRLDDLGKIKGRGVADSRIRRLANRYRDEIENKL